ncbi:MAG: hypothetical protein J7L47_01565 [Candidatus Odinarchaeota archaeon]|nr:hypothetical protein [Candidatus Odinarchaeota archaeon]
MNKTYDVVLYLRAKNVTSDLIDYLHMEIGNFSVRAVMNSSEIASDFNYSLLYTILQKYQILAAIKLSIVDLIILNQQVYDLFPRNNNTNNSGTNSQSEDNRIFWYFIYMGLTVLYVVLINIYIRQKRKLLRRPKRMHAQQELS